MEVHAGHLVVVVPTKLPPKQHPVSFEESYLKAVGGEGLAQPEVLGEARRLDGERRAVAELLVQPRDLPAYERRAFAYAESLRFFEEHLPVEATPFFVWTDVLTEGPLSAARRDCLQFERASVLFNYAALLTQEAAAKLDAGGEDAKEALNFYRRAAGCVEHLAEELACDAVRDLQAQRLVALAALLDAGARHSTYLRSRDALKPKSLATLAGDAERAYRDAGSFVRPLAQTGPAPLRRDLLQAAEFNAELFRQLGCLHRAEELCSILDDTANVGRISEEIGPMIGALRHFCGVNLPAVKFAVRPPAHSSYVKTCDQLTDALQAVLAKLQRERDTVYLSSTRMDFTIPEPVMKLKLERQPFALQGIEVDRLEGVVPHAVRQSVQRGADAARQSLSVAADAAEKRLAELKAALTEANAEGLLSYSAGGEEKLPDRLEERIARVHSDTEGAPMDFLHDTLRRIQSVSDAALDHADEAAMELDRLKAEDNVGQAEFGEEWRQVLQQFDDANETRSCRELSKEYHQSLASAREYDSALRARAAKLDAQGGSLLALTADALLQRAAGGAGAGGQAAPTSGEVEALVQQLRPLLSEHERLLSAAQEQARELADGAGEPERLEEESKGLAGDGAAERVQQLLAGSAARVEVRTERLEERVSAVAKVVEKAVDLAGRVRAAVESMLVASGVQENKLASLVNETMAAYDEFDEVRREAELGTQFYRHMSEACEQLRRRVADYAKSTDAQRAEVRELLHRRREREEQLARDRALAQRLSEEERQRFEERQAQIRADHEFARVSYGEEEQRPRHPPPGCPPPQQQLPGWGPTPVHPANPYVWRQWGRPY